MNKENIKPAISSVMALHKGLLEYQKALSERVTGKSLNPYEALHAALHDETFSWLKPLSQMIVQLDIESEDQEDPKRKTEVMGTEAIKDFFRNPPQDFHAQLLKAIEFDPDISFLFSKAKQSVLSL